MRFLLPITVGLLLPFSASALTIVDFSPGTRFAPTSPSMVVTQDPAGFLQFIGPATDGFAVFLGTYDPDTGMGRGLDLSLIADPDSLVAASFQKDILNTSIRLTIDLFDPAGERISTGAFELVTASTTTFQLSEVIGFDKAKDYSNVAFIVFAGDNFFSNVLSGRVDSLDVSVIPEPSSVPLVLALLILSFGTRRRRLPLC